MFRNKYRECYAKLGITGNKTARPGFEAPVEAQLISPAVETQLTRYV